jgi:hypothetical protein
VGEDLETGDLLGIDFLRKTVLPLDFNPGRILLEDRKLRGIHGAILGQFAPPNRQNPTLLEPPYPPQTLISSGFHKTPHFPHRTENPCVPGSIPGCGTISNSFPEPILGSPAFFSKVSRLPW